MAVTIVGNNTPTAGSVVYGDGTNYASTAVGTAGGVLYSAGSGAPAFNAVGTSGQVLTSAGASAPTWATLSPSAMTFISSVTASNSATIDVENAMTAFDTYVITITNLIPSTSGGVQFRTRLKLGGTYQTTANYGGCTLLVSSGAVSTDSNDALTYLNVARNNLFTATDSAGAGANAIVHIMNPASTVQNKPIFSQIVATGGTNPYTTGNQMLAGTFNAASSTLTGVRFFFSTGNISTGTFRLYGISNS